MKKIPDLTISAAKIATIIAKARQFDAKDVVTDPDSGSNASDDAMLSVLEDHSDDSVRSELMAIIRGLNEDEQIDLVALTWLGRGDGELGDWDDIRAEASRAHTGARLNISWEYRFSATISKRLSPNLAIRWKSLSSPCKAREASSKSENPASVAADVDLRISPKF